METIISEWVLVAITLIGFAMKPRSAAQSG